MSLLQAKIPLLKLSIMHMYMLRIIVLWNFIVSSSGHPEITELFYKVPPFSQSFFFFFIISVFISSKLAAILFLRTKIPQGCNNLLTESVDTKLQFVRSADIQKRNSNQ